MAEKDLHDMKAKLDRATNQVILAILLVILHDFV